MTAKELAAMLNGREVGNEITRREAQESAAAGLVVVYGYSDDNVELAGAIDDEVGAYEGATVYLTPAGVLQEPDCDRDNCPYFACEREKAKNIKAVWHDEGGPGMMPSLLLRDRRGRPGISGMMRSEENNEAD